MKFTNLIGKKFKSHNLRYIYSGWKISDGDGVFCTDKYREKEIVRHEIVEDNNYFKGQECVYISGGADKYYIFPVEQLILTKQLLEFLSKTYEIF